MPQVDDELEFIDKGDRAWRTTLQFGELWTGSESNADPVTQAKLFATAPRVFLTAKTTYGGTTIVAIDDDTNGGITWINTSLGIVDLEIENNIVDGVVTKILENCVWELKVKAIDGNQYPIAWGDSWRFIPSVVGSVS